MAEFCFQCMVALGVDGTCNDFKDLCKKGETIEVLCEGCGPTQVDYEGKCVSPDCEHHVNVPKALQDDWD